MSAGVSSGLLCVMFEQEHSARGVFVAGETGSLLPRDGNPDPEEAHTNPLPLYFGMNANKRENLLVLLLEDSVDSIWACRIDRPGTTMLGSVRERNSGADERFDIPPPPPPAVAPAPPMRRPSCTLLNNIKKTR